MTRISEKQLNRRVLLRISELLIAHIANIHTKSHSERFLNEILTPTEKIMLAKRLAIVIMLYRKQSYADIIKILKVSPSTIGRIRNGIRKGEFDFIISQLPKKHTRKINAAEKNPSNLWITLDIMFGGGIPSMGKNRWKFLDDIEKKKRLIKKNKIN